MKRIQLALASFFVLGACQFHNVPQPHFSSAPLLAQNRGLQLDFVQHIPNDLSQTLWTEAQNYADLVSRRRQLPLFRLSSQFFGLQFQHSGDRAYILSYLGTPDQEPDVNVELRLLHGQNTQMNLNYSGPLTQTLQTESEQTTPLSAQSSEAFEFELIMGLPGQGITEAYGRYLDSLGQYLKQRFGARPLTWNDAPLVYAVHLKGQLQGFVFMNQRNPLVLGERKYADVQNMVFFSTQRERLGAYTLIGFNPKTDAEGQLIDIQVDNDTAFGHLIVLGEY